MFADNQPLPEPFQQHPYCAIAADPNMPELLRRWANHAIRQMLIRWQAYTS